MGNRRGSALLIVLGFLSFMVVSAVAFSIYMRSERVPSSVFRRSVSVRHLVKAGLAHAIAELDDAIRGDPYPGMHNDNSLRANQNFSSGESHYADTWLGRVFMPPNPDDENDGSYMAPGGETVSVLNLEGLGYVPPPLVNDVRFLSRRSWAAKWRNFDYGAGRFAYCAVNVSDYFDINRLPADEPRSSAQRINLSSLFADDFKSQNNGVSDAGTFRDFVRTRGGTQSSWPFVSMLDYTLAMRSGAGGFESPYYRWIGSSSSGVMYQGVDDDAKEQVFVTDSWMPEEPNDGLAESAIIDLNDRGSGNSQDAHSGQPFPSAWMQDGNSKSLQDVKNSSNSDFIKRVASGNLPSGSSLGGGQNRSLNYTDAAMLKDYLDRDDTPTSLALPCVERVPMAASLGISRLTINLGLVGSTRVDGPTPGPGGTSITTTYTEFKPNPSMFGPGNVVSVGVVFPFKRAREINQTFKAKAIMRVFLIEEGSTGLRFNGTTLANMRPSGDLASSEWNTGSSFTLPGTAGSAPFVFTMVSREESINTGGGDILEQEDVAVGSNNGSVTFEFDPPSGFDGQIVFTQKVEAHTAAATPAAPSPTPTPQPPEYCFNVSPFGADGSMLEPNAATWYNETDFAAKYGTRKFSLHAAVWVCIFASNGDVVDLVPATGADDNQYNGIDGNLVQMQGYDGVNGAGMPIFRFRMANSTIYDVANQSSPLNIPAGAWTPGAYCVVDPRFNWAPENWIPRDAVVTGDDWVKWVTGRTPANDTDTLLADNGRDSDIFMFVSNQGFLQSMGELAFLPFLTDFGNQTVQGSTSLSDLLRACCMNFNGTEYATSDPWTRIPCADIVWRTYRPYRSASNSNNSQYLLSFLNFYGGGNPASSHAFRDMGVRGTRVNPYTDNENVRMAAFAYTPYDWWAAAGTNTVGSSSNSSDSEGTRRGRFGNLSSSRKYTFHENSSEAKMKDEEIRALGNAICNEIRNQAGSDWQTVYDNLDWYGNNSIDPDNEDSFRDFLGVRLDEPLHGVDRKFLYAYWRGCLANRQQLFLVFVRAESMALGGSGGGQIPPQQGGRAVALVWRDPKAPSGSSETATTGADSRKPHRTRVLFYHQFD